MSNNNRNSDSDARPPAPDANTALIRATERSFGIIVPLTTIRSNHREVQVILHRIQEGGKHYIESVSESFETAQSGFEFAKKARDLCLGLGQPDCSEKVIRDSITEMRAIAQKAHKDAKATTAKFDANRQEFTEIRTSTLETLKEIKIKRKQILANKEKAEAKEASAWVLARLYKHRAKGHAKKATSFEDELRNLEPAEEDLHRLRAEMDTVAEYWMGVDTELADIENRANALQNDHMLQMRVRGLTRDWDGVAQDQKGYIQALNTLLKNNPQYKAIVERRAIAAA